nr:phage holin family protein [Corynebacterium flavescens]
MSSLLNFILNVIAIAVAFWAVVTLVPGISITPDTTGNFIAIAVVFILINAVGTPVLRFFGAPLTCLTLGLFALVINGAVLFIVSWALRTLDLGIGYLHIESWWAAIFGAIILSIVSGVVNFFTSPLRVVP